MVHPPEGEEESSVPPQGAEPVAPEPEVMFSPLQDDARADPPIAAAAEQPDYSELVGRIVAEITGVLQARAGADQFRERQVERLQEELQSYRNENQRRAVLPVFSALVRLHSESVRAVYDYRARPAESIDSARLLTLLDEFREDLEHILQDNGVQVFVDQELGESFNPRKQQIVGREPTTNPSLHSTIASRVRPGFEFGGALLKKEAVRVFALALTKDPQGLPAGELGSAPDDRGDVQ